MVLADGNIMTVNVTQNTDLFWAIRGGGGNFGIVSSFKFQAHSVKINSTKSFLLSLEGSLSEKLILH